MVIILIRSAAKMNEPLSTARNNGFLPSMSLFMRSATTFTCFNISSSVYEILNVLSCIFTVDMMLLLIFWHKITKNMPNVDKRSALISYFCTDEDFYKRSDT